MVKRSIIKPNIHITDDIIEANNQFSNEMFGKLTAIKQDMIEEIKHSVKSKKKINLRITFT